MGWRETQIEQNLAHHCYHEMSSAVLNTLCDDRSSIVFTVVTQLMGDLGQGRLGIPAAKQENDQGSQLRTLVRTRTCPQSSGD